MKCNLIFERPFNLRRHNAIFHNENGKYYTKEKKGDICPHCGGFYYNVKHHIENTHLKLYKFKCTYCDYSSRTKNYLTLHIRRKHEEVNPVNCPWCGAYVKLLDKHLKEKQCNIPEEERKVKEKYPCQLCEKTFTFKQGLNTHMKTIHEKIKDFHCKLCDYKTYGKSNLYIHVKRMHEGRPLKESCPHCDKVVVNLEYHLRTYHVNC